MGGNNLVDGTDFQKEEESQAPSNWRVQKSLPNDKKIIKTKIIESLHQEWSQMRESRKQTNNFSLFQMLTLAQSTYMNMMVMPSTKTCRINL